MLAAKTILRSDSASPPPPRPLTRPSATCDVPSLTRLARPSAPSTSTTQWRRQLSRSRQHPQNPARNASKLVRMCKIFPPRCTPPPAVHFAAFYFSPAKLSSPAGACCGVADAGLQLQRAPASAYWNDFFLPNTGFFFFDGALPPPTLPRPPRPPAMPSIPSSIIIMNSSGKAMPLTTNWRKNTRARAVSKWAPRGRAQRGRRKSSGREQHSKQKHERYPPPRPPRMPPPPPIIAAPIII